MRDLAPPVTVIIVAFGHAQVLRAALKPLQAFDVIVIDNSSSADVAEAAALFGARYMDSGSNLGFAAGVNLGVRLAELSSDLLLLNPDAVVQPSDVAALAKRLHAEPKVAAVAPRLRDPETGQEQRGGWPFPTPWRAWCNALVPRHHGAVEFLVGACLLIRRDAWDDVGALDEQFFLYAEETDWQRRAAQRGWHVALVPDVEVAHVGAGTSNDAHRREALFHAGTETYVRKWFGTSGWVSYRLASIVGAALRFMTRPGPRRREDLMRLRIYLRGPRRAARLVS